MEEVLKSEKSILDAAQKNNVQDKMKKKNRVTFWTANIISGSAMVQLWYHLTIESNYNDNCRLN